jgi:hypothetical protein
MPAIDARAASARLAIGDRRNATDGQGGRHFPPVDASHPLAEHRVSVRVHAGDRSWFSQSCDGHVAGNGGRRRCQ